MLVSRRLCWASLSSNSVISTVRGMPFLRNNSVALNQLGRASPANGETKIPDDEIAVSDEIGYENALIEIAANIYIAPAAIILFHLAHY